MQIYGYVRSDNYGDKVFEEFCLYLFISNLFITMNYLIIEVFVLSITFLAIVLLVFWCISCIICKRNYSDDRWESRWYVNRAQLFEENSTVANGVKDYIIHNLAFKFDPKKYSEIVAQHEQERQIKLKNKDGNKNRSDAYKVNENDEEAKNRSSSDTQTNICVICYDNLELEQMTVCLECDGNHIFHRRCLNEWINVKLTCPACRADLKALYNHKYEHELQLPELTPEDNFLYIEDFITKFSRKNVEPSEELEVDHPILVNEVQIQIDVVQLANPLMNELRSQDEEEKENENFDQLIRRNTFDQLSSRRDFSISYEIPYTLRVENHEPAQPLNDISEVPNDEDM